MIVTKSSVADWRLLYGFNRREKVKRFILRLLGQKVFVYLSSEHHVYFEHNGERYRVNLETRTVASEKE